MSASLDRYHHFFPTLLGWVAVGLTPGGQVERLSIHRISNGDDTMLFDTTTVRQPLTLGCLKNQLNGYFQRQCRTFNLPLAPSGTDFQERVWNEVLTIQFGQCLDFSVIAQRVGAPSNSVAVARAIRANPIAILIPSHRVLGWENVALVDSSIEWLNRLRTLEDIVPGESTCMTYNSLPSTALELARTAAISPSAHFRSNEVRKLEPRPISRG